MSEDRLDVAIEARRQEVRSIAGALGEVAPQEPKSLRRALGLSSAVDHALTLREALLGGRQRFPVTIGQGRGFEALTDSGVQLETKSSRRRGG